MRKLIITILFMSAGFITFAQKIPSKYHKKGNSGIRVYCHRTEF